MKDGLRWADFMICVGTERWRAAAAETENRSWRMQRQEGAEGKLAREASEQLVEGQTTGEFLGNFGVRQSDLAALQAIIPIILGHSAI